jgi:hypothetical protein
MKRSAPAGAGQRHLVFIKGKMKNIHHSSAA